MQNFKFIIISLIVLVGISFLTYWAFITIEPGDIHAAKQKQLELENQNKELAAQVANLQSQVEGLRADQAKQTQVVDTTQNTTPPPATAQKYQSLVNDLQKLSEDKVYMKEKSQGTRVGTVQTFLNIYNKASKKIDNDYGAGTKTDVAAFQKAQGLNADGTAGPSTYLKMIDWLKKQ